MGSCIARGTASILGGPLVWTASSITLGDMLSFRHSDGRVADVLLKAVLAVQPELPLSDARSGAVTYTQAVQKNGLSSHRSFAVCILERAATNKTVSAFARVNFISMCLTKIREEP